MAVEAFPAVAALAIEASAETFRPSVSPPCYQSPFVTEWSAARKVFPAVHTVIVAIVVWRRLVAVIPATKTLEDGEMARVHGAFVAAMRWRSSASFVSFRRIAL